MLYSKIYLTFSLYHLQIKSVNFIYLPLYYNNKESKKNENLLILLILGNLEIMNIKQLLKKHFHLKSEILEQIVKGNHDEDDGIPDEAVAANHFDACQFYESVNNINEKYHSLREMSKPSSIHL